MKAFNKNRIFSASAAVVLVTAIAVTSFLLISNGAAAYGGTVGSDPTGISSADPAGMDTQPESELRQVVTPADGQEERTVPADESPSVEAPSAENGTIEDGSKDIHSTTDASADRVDSGTKAAPQEQDDSVSAGDTSSEEDYNPKSGEEPYYGADTSNPPSNNIDEIPDYSIDDTPGNTDGGGKPGQGIKF